MSNESQTANNPKPSLAPMLSVRHGAKAVEFYKPAFRAGELFRLEAPDGAVVAWLSVGESEFWVADESAPHAAKTAPYGDPALRSTRTSALSLWAAPRCGW
jgi:PhnB protein